MGELEVVKRSIDMISTMALMVTVEDAKKLVDEFERMKALMPIADPSGWLLISKTIKDNNAAAIAFLEFRRALETIKEQGNVR